MKNELMNDEVLEGTISNIAFGGEGIIRQEGLVTFIPYAAIGDKLSYKITEQKKNFAKGTIVDVLTPSPQRTTPLCSYFGTCGGCQLQHVTYATQLEYKRQWVEDALKRQAGLTDITVPPVIASQQEWAYRRRISLTLKADFDHYKAGYIGINHTSLIEVEHCPIFLPEESPILSSIHQIAQKLESTDRSDAKVTILKQTETTAIIHFHFKKMPENAAKVFQDVLAEHPHFSGIFATSPKKTLQYGKIESTFTFDGLSFDYSPQAFVQNHPQQSANIYQSISSHADKITKETAKGTVLDLYCGIGISSLLLARQGFTVTGIEANGAAVQLAKTNAKKNKISNVNFIKQDVEESLAAQLKQTAPVLAIINPPREGISTGVLNTLLENPPSVLIYVSCMPPTLGRDLKLLCAKAYKVDAVEAYDMFPQTAHVETLVVLKAK